MVGKKTINQGGNYEVDFIFQVDNLEEHYQFIEEKPVFNGMLVVTLLGISFSTLRGMLISLWKDTKLHNVIPPVISVPELLKSKRQQ